MKKLTNNDIAESALKHEACKPGLKKILESKSEAELLDLYKKNIDFCLSENFPSSEQFEKVDSLLLEGHGIFLDGDALLRDRDFIVLLGSCFAGIEYTGYNVGQLFIKHDSAADVSVKDKAYVVIDCFDDSELKIEALADSKVLINVYGNAKVIQEQKDNAIIKIVNKQKEGY